MAIMKWNTPPTGTMHDRHAHVVGHGDNVALAHSAFGEHVDGGGGQASGPNVELATKWSTAPYTGPDQDLVEKPPLPNMWGYRHQSREKRCMGNNDTCAAWATAKYDGQYCNGHGASLAKTEE